MKALIIYGSTTGNTENMAETIKKVLDESGVQTEMKDASEAIPEDLTSSHDMLILGCPAYGDETIELQEDFEEFYEKWNGINLNGKKYAVFAPGDSSYEFFCGTVDMLEEKLAEFGGEQVAVGLKIDGDPDDAQDEIMDWAHSIITSVS